MEQSTIAILIILATVILYAIDKLPLALVSMLSVLAMVWTGVLTFSDAFSGFASTLVMLVAGMMIIGNTLFETGVAESVGKRLFGRFQKSEKMLLIAIMFASAFLSAFLHNTSVMVMFMPMISAYAKKSDGVIRIRNFYMPLAHSTIIGGCATLCGSSPPLLAQNVLLGTEGLNEQLGFFETALVAVPVLLVLVLCYYLFIYKLENKLFDFADKAENVDLSSIVHTEVSSAVPKWKMWVSGLTMVLCAALFITSSLTGFNLGVISLSCACLLLMTGCADAKSSVRNIDWSTIIILGAATGFAKGFQASGLGELIIESLKQSMGAAVSSPVLWVIVFVFLSNIIANFMAASAATVIFSSLAISVSTSIGISAIPLVVASIFGVCCAFSMPTATATVTMSTVAGYRFKDYARVGTLASFICCTAICISIICVYGLV